MTDNDLNKILNDLYALEPELRQHTEALKKLIIQMSDFRPDTKFDPAFAARLKDKILSQQVEPSVSFTNLINYNFMNKKIYLTTGALAVVAIAIIAVVSISGPKLILPGTNNISLGISELSDKAFGSLTTNNVASKEAAPVAMGLGGATMSGVMAERSVGAGGDAMAAVSSVSLDAKMIAPYFAYRYEYKGESLSLEDASGAVFRRLKNDGQSGRALASLLTGFSFPNLNLDAFTNLRATNLSLMEDKDLGLMVNFDFNEDTVYISENWEKWRIMERENCGNDQACYDRWRLKISDVPADDELIAMANQLLTDKQIDRENYGAPVVDNSWRIMYDQTADKNNAYVPEYATVVYPLIINDEAVRDQSGSYAGLRVTINLLKKAASGVSGLSPYRYESSSYDLETASDIVISAAEKGGWNRMWYGETANVSTLELGTPEKTYVQWWRYANGRNDELVVPALIFPILNIPTENYYGPRQIIVPLVKEMLVEINQNDQIMPRPIDGGIGDQPVIMTKPAAATEPTIIVEPRVNILPLEPGREVLE